jgi:hypothetical protein
MMIGSGMPKSQSSAPRPNPISASFFLCFVPLSENHPDGLTFRNSAFTHRPWCKRDPRDGGLHQKTFGNVSVTKMLTPSANQGEKMGTFVGPNGRLYRRKTSKAKWIAISVATMTAAALAFMLRGLW